jgi:hypothetical protein
MLIAPFAGLMTSQCMKDHEPDLVDIADVNPANLAASAASGEAINLTDSAGVPPTSLADSAASDRAARLADDAANGHTIVPEYDPDPARDPTFVRCSLYHGFCHQALSTAMMAWRVILPLYDTLPFVAARPP